MRRSLSLGTLEVFQVKDETVRVINLGLGLADNTDTPLVGDFSEARFDVSIMKNGRSTSITEIPLSYLIKSEVKHGLMTEGFVSGDLYQAVLPFDLGKNIQLKGNDYIEVKVNIPSSVHVDATTGNSNLYFETEKSTKRDGVAYERKLFMVGNSETEKDLSFGNSVLAVDYIETQTMEAFNPGNSTFRGVDVRSNIINDEYSENNLFVGYFQQSSLAGAELMALPIIKSGQPLINLRARVKYGTSSTPQMAFVAKRAIRL